MSKRRSRKSSSQPNLPAEAVARARREAGLEVDETPPGSSEDLIEEPVLSAAPVVRRPPETMPPVQRRKRRKEKEINPSQLTSAEVAEMLSHPTRTVTEDELREQYTYVLADLRSMGVLAGALFVVMILVAQFISR